MKSIDDPLRNEERERRWRTERGVARISLVATAFAASVAEVTAKPPPEIEPQLTPDGSRCKAICNPADTSGEATVRDEMRDARSEMKPPFQPGITIQLTELLETEGKRTDAGEIPSSDSERSSLRPNDVRRHAAGESPHEAKDRISVSRSGRSAWLWSRLIGRGVSNEDGPPLITDKAAFTSAKEQIQILQTRIEKWCAESGKRMLLIASAVRNEGKSFVALNLAAACASPRTPVLLIDGNLRTPSLHHALGVSSGNGLGAYLNGVSRFTDSLYQTNIPGLTFIPVGDFKGSAIRVFADSRMGDFVDAARALRPPHLIVIDSSAALAAAEVQILAGLVDATLLVTAANRTPRAAVLEAVNLLNRSPLFGVVLNRFEASISTLRTIRRGAH